MNEILTLTWKEYRNNFHLIVFAAAVLMLPVLWCMAVTYANASSQATLVEIVALSLTFGSLGGIVLSQFVMLCLGGHLIGGERSGRTFEFLFLQPVSRLKIACCKLLFVATWMLLTWMLAGAIALIGIMLMSADQSESYGDFVNSSYFVEVATVGLLLFATGWLASSRLESSVVAMCVGALISTGIFLFLLMVVGERGKDFFTFNDYDWTRIIVMAPLSLVAIVGGVVLFTKRKSP